jgi:hypothetical protein
MLLRVVTSCMIPEIARAVAGRPGLFDVSGELLVAHLHAFDATMTLGPLPDATSPAAANLAPGGGTDEHGPRQPRPPAAAEA